MDGHLDGSNVRAIDNYNALLDRTMFVNSWNPFSVVGNGNAADKSLDGQFGRRTAMAVLATPPVNGHMAMQALDDIDDVLGMDYYGAAYDDEEGFYDGGA